MDLFDKISKKATEAYKITADKTGKFAKDTKLKIKMNDLKSQINEIYEEIGKKVYEKHLREEEISIKDELEEECTKIDVLSNEIENLLHQSLDLNDKKQCKDCSSLIGKEDKFCHECGAKQDDFCENLETEKIEITKGANNETERENQITIEEIEEDEGEKTSLEKTVEVESHVAPELSEDIGFSDEGYDEDDEDEIDDEEN